MRVGRRESARRVLNLVTHRTFALPLVVLMPHSRCNARCVMCDIWKANHDKRELTVEDLEPHLEVFERLKTRRVVLSGGEALMHPNLWAFTSLLRGRGIRLTLLTTGLTLERHASEVATWCDDVVISVDGSPAVHDDIRNVPRAFEKLTRGLHALRAASPTIRVTARSVVQRKNYFDLANIIEETKRVGFDAVSFLPVDVSSQAFNRLKIWGQERVDETALTLGETDELEALVEKIIYDHAEDIDRGFVSEDRVKLRRIPQYFRAANGNGPFPPVVCNAPWTSTVIEADGTVRPCFFHAPYGNIRDGRIDEILDSPKAIAFRKQLDVSKDATCRRCVCSLHIRPRTEL